MVASRVGTHRPREMKHGGGPVEDVQKGNVPVLQYYQTRYNLRSYSRCHTIMNNAKTVEWPRELPGVGRRRELTPGFSSGPSIIYLCNGQNTIPPSMNARAPDLVSEGQEVVVKQ